MEDSRTVGSGRIGESEVSHSGHKVHTKADVASWKCPNSGSVASKWGVDCQGGLGCVIWALDILEGRFSRVDKEET